MLRVAICDDDSQQMEIIQRFLDKYQTTCLGPDMQAFSFNSARTLLDDLESGRSYSLYLLDILMPDLSGIELARELRLRGENAPLIFLTSSASYALDAFDVNATQYILKPVNEEALFSILDKAIADIGKKENKSMLISTHERKVRVAFSSVVCVESVNRTLRIHLADGVMLDSKTIRVPFAASVAPLKSDPRFLHAHNSFVLNMDQVLELSANSFIMKGGLEVPVPRYKYANAKTKYLDYLMTRGINFIGGQ